MAHKKSIHTWAFLLVVLTCHEILFTAGRQLTAMKKQELHSEKDGSNMEKYNSRTIKTHKYSTRKEYDVKVTRVDHSVVGKKETFPPLPSQSMGFSAVAEPINDFRPTTPGNSPGIGHSYTEHNVEIQSERASDVEISFTDEEMLKPRKKQEVRPIEDGSSMGKHGGRIINSQKSPTRKEHDAQVTSADDHDHSHKVEHSIPRKKGTSTPPPSQTTEFSAVTQPITAFRPTTPGNSPGVGHAYTQHYVDSPSFHPSIAGTEPDHTPVLGHSFKRKNAEPNA